MSGWSVESPGSGPDPAPGAGTGPSGAPADPAAWTMPEAPAGEPAWAVPELGGTPADAPAATLGAGPEPDRAPTSGWTSEPEAAPPPRLPVPLRAMTGTDILDGAWAIIKARPRTVFLITAIIVLPTEVLAAVATQGAAGSATDLLVSAVDGRPTTGGAFLGSFGLLLGEALQNLAPFFLGAALASLVSSWYAGGDLSVRQALVAAFRKAPALLGAFALLVPVKLLGLATCGMGLLVVVPFFLVTAPAIAIEDLGPWAGVKRAFTLARRRYWSVMGVFLLALVCELVVNVALSLLPLVVAAFFPGVAEVVIGAASTVFAAFVTKPFVVGVAVLQYLDLRVRTEALDLELEAGPAFARAA